MTLKSPRAPTFQWGAHKNNKSSAAWFCAGERAATRNQQLDTLLSVFAAAAAVANVNNSGGGETKGGDNREGNERREGLRISTPFRADILFLKHA